MYHNFTLLFENKEAAIEFVNKQHRLVPAIFAEVGVKTVVDAIWALDLGYIPEGDEEDSLVAHGSHWLIELHVLRSDLNKGDRMSSEGFSTDLRNTVRVSRRAVCDYVHKQK